MRIGIFAAMGMQVSLVFDEVKIKVELRPPVARYASRSRIFLIVAILLAHGGSYGNFHLFLGMMTGFRRRRDLTLRSVGLLRFFLILYSHQLGRVNE